MPKSSRTRSTPISAMLSRSARATLVDMSIPDSVISSEMRRASTPVASSASLNGAGEVGGADLAGGDVDEHAPGEVGVARKEAARLAQHERPERDHEVRLLGDRDELRWHQEPPRGVLPAHEGLVGDDGLGLEVHDGLIVDGELAVANGDAQLGLDRQLVERRLPEVRREDLHARAPDCLAAYIAVSASRIRVSAVTSPAAIASPTLIEGTTSCPATVMGDWTAFVMARAMDSAPA